MTEESGNDVLLADHERLLLRQLHRRTSEESVEARQRFPSDKAIETLPMAYGITALVEEIGKLARASNKLVIAEDEEVIRQWRQEVNDKIRTSISLLERIYLTHRVGFSEQRVEH